MAVLEALTVKPPVQPFDSRRHWQACLMHALVGFNLADILVVGGAGLLVLAWLVSDKGRRA